MGIQIDKTASRPVSLLLAGMLYFLGCGSAFAVPFLSVDFQPDGAQTQVGFGSMVGSEAAGKTFVTTEGNVTVAVSNFDSFFSAGGGDVLSNGGAFTFANLYNDFVYSNGGATLHFSISGLQANTLYQITWYGYQPGQFATNVTNSIAAAGNTTGSSGNISFDPRSAPLSNDQFGFTGVWSAPDSSLEIDIGFVSDDWVGGSAVRTNGFQLSRTSAVPEPGIAALLGIGLAGLAISRRKKAQSKQH